MPGFSRSFRRSGMLHLSRSAYNEIQMVVAKDHFSRHLNELTFRRWDDSAGKLHTFRRCERLERKENAATDTVADMARILTLRRWDDFAEKLHTFRRSERPERKENQATDAVADMARILTLRRWDDFAGKLHTFRRCERPERKENAATDTVADMARILTFRRWDDFAGKLHTFRRCERPGEGGRLLDGYLTADSYLKSMSKRPTHSPWAPAWTTTTSRPTRFL